MKPKITIIDSGISGDFIQIGAANIVGKFNVLQDDEDVNDNIGHGTAIANIIFSINKECKLNIIKIFDNVLATTEDMFLKALEYVINNIECDFLHISSGTQHYNAEIHDACKAIYDKGITIVSAFDNAGCISYPAGFDFVIGVESSESCIRSTDFIIPSDEVVSVYAKGGIHKVAWIKSSYVIQKGNSMSAAYVTGHLSRLVQGKIDKDESLEFLKGISTYSVNSNSSDIQSKTLYQEPFFNIDKAALFPLNKEMTSLINYFDMLNFKISDIYSSKYLGNIGNRVQNIFNSFDAKVKNIEQADFSTIDTTIIGHLSDLETISNVDYKKTLLSRCLNENINVYSFDSLGVGEFHHSFKEKGLFLCVPVLATTLRKKCKGKQYNISSPVLGVFGTSSKQGKFTLQLQIRKLMLEEGYSIAQMSSEPTGMLFGMEECVPFGFNSFNSMGSNEFISEINELMHRLDILQSELIIVGSQSGTVPEAYNHLGQLPIRQIEFLLGCMPDGIVLCVNPNDDIGYIARTIGLIENLSKAKVIALGIYPFFTKTVGNLQLIVCVKYLMHR